MACLCGQAQAETLNIDAGTFTLRWDEQARPVSCQLKADGQERLNVKGPNQGFYLKGWDGSKIWLSVMKLLDVNHLEVATSDQHRSLVLALRRGTRSLAWRVEKVQGIPVAERWTLGLALKVAPRFKLLPLDYMTEVKRSAEGVGAECQALGLDEVMGGFVLYESHDAADEDDVLLHLWVEEALPHPKVKGAWNLEVAQTWLQTWQQRFKNRTQFILEAKSPEELRTGLQVAKQAGAQQIYLFTNTWRNDGFMPDKFGNIEINHTVFPRGEVDLAQFAQEVQQQGMYLGLHYVSGGIGRSDRHYIGQKPDRRLASWGEAKLVEAVTSQANGLKVKLSPGSFWPTQSQSWAHGINPEVFQWQVIRVEDEIIRFNRFNALADGIYELQGCRRGEGSTLATEHPVGAEAQGLLLTYGINYLPDNHQSLLRELAENYVGMVNRCGIEHVEFDGAEIHNYDGPWGYRKFATFVYQGLEHPATSHDSMGQRPACWFEYRFNSSQKLMAGSCYYSHGNWCVPLELDSLSREASNLLDAHFVLSQGYRGGALGLCKPEPMFGVRPSDLKAHGLTPNFLQALRVWQGVDARLDDEQLRRMAAYFKAPAYLHGYGFNHHDQAEVVPVAAELADHYEITPVRVLRRVQGDITWQVGQEHGPIGPRQVLRLGEPVDLVNPEKPQPLAFIMRVLPAFDLQAATVNLDPKLGKLIPDSALQNIVLLPHSTPTIPEGALTKMTQQKDGWLLEAENTLAQPVRQPETLPTWGLRADLSHHRGIAVEVEGDGSGARLLVQLGYRDYIIPLDFKGRREVVIPHGEVSWYRGDWGWRFATKQNRYEQTSRLRIGFGELPAHTVAKVKLYNLRALEEISVALKDPVVQVGEARLQVKGVIPTGTYLQYDGAEMSTRAKVFDANWNLLKEVEVSDMPLMTPTGLARYSVETDAPQEAEKPWLEIQFLVKGASWMIPKP